MSLIRNLFFHKKFVGLDISDYSVEIAEVTKNKGKIRVTGLGRALLPAGIVERGRIKKEDELIRIIKNILAGAKQGGIRGNDIIFGLPECQTYLHFFKTFSVNKTGLSAVVQREIMSATLIEERDIIYAYQVNVNISANIFLVVSVAASRRVIKEWSSFFSRAGLLVKMFDIETLALFRGLFNKPLSEPACLIDIGAVTTNISIFTANGLSYAYSLKLAGKDFTKAIGEKLKISPDKAEELKKEIGLNGDVSPKKEASLILKEILDKIIKIIKENINYWEGKNIQRVKKIILAGGSSLMPGIDKYFSNANLGAEIILEKPWFTSPAYQSAEIYQKAKKNYLSPRRYIEAVGLALRGIDSRWQKTDPFFPVSENKEGASAIYDLFLNKIRTINIKPLKKYNIKIIILIILLFVSSWLIYNFLNKDKEKLPKNNNQNLPISEQQEAIAGPAIYQKKDGEADEKLKIKVKDLKAPLNVRAGPGSNYQIISKINSGEEYFLLEEKEDWLKIKLADDLSGWVFISFVHKIN